MKTFFSEIQLQAKTLTLHTPLTSRVGLKGQDIEIVQINIFLIELRMLALKHS